MHFARAAFYYISFACSCKCTNVVHFILLYFNNIHKFPIMTSLNYNKDLFTWLISA